jgi:hypothetical protein
MKHKTLSRYGGSGTPQYFCTKCKKAHTITKMIGKEHLKFKQT